MTKKSHQGSAQLSGPVYRQGEGFAIETVRRQVVGLEGETSLTLGVDLSQAPVPDRHYVADIYDVVVEPTGCKLLFAQQRIRSTDLRNLLVVQMQTVGAMNMLRALNEMAAPSLREIATQVKATAEAPAHLTEEPKDSVAMSATIVGVAVAGSVATLDFFQMSAATIHNAVIGGKVQVKPVVRVEVRTGQLLGLVECLNGMPTLLDVKGKEHAGF